jgi:hypothetical protein
MRTCGIALGAVLILALVSGARAADDGQAGSSAAPLRDEILIFNGITTCKGCPEAVEAVADRLNLKTRTIGDFAGLAEALKGADLFVIPGTDDDIAPLIAALTPAVRGTVAAWIRGGGRFLGLCGGAVVAAEPYLGLVPAYATSWIDDPAARLVAVEWLGHRRMMYYQSGPRFDLLPDGPPVEVIARYDDGTLAALEAPLGRGTVIVSGVHPEADAGWLSDDGIPSQDWQPTAPLAADLLRRALMR